MFTLKPSQYIVASSQGRPSPKNTLTALLPLILPIELSAVFSFTAAALLANVSGMLVPKATSVIAVTVVSKPIKHPNIVARSPTTAVNKPIIPKEHQNVNQPPATDVGGTHRANKT